MKLTISILAILTFCINAYSQVPNYVPTNGLVGWWPFNECLGLRDMEDKEWESVEDLITQTTNLLEIKMQLKVKELKVCGAS